MDKKNKIAFIIGFIIFLVVGTITTIFLFKLSPDF